MKTKLNSIVSFWKFFSPQFQKPSLNTILVNYRPYHPSSNLNSLLLFRPITTTLKTAAKNKKASTETLKINKEENTESENIFETGVVEEEQYEQLVNKAQLLPRDGHQVFIVQPFVKWGRNKNDLTTPDLMLEEAVALVDSLPKWKCVDATKIAIADNLERKQVFGAGQFDILTKEVRRNPNISAVFVSINRLRGIQKK